MERDSNTARQGEQAKQRKQNDIEKLQGITAVKILDFPLFGRMKEAKRLIQKLALHPEDVEMEWERDSNYGRVSFVTDYLCWSVRDLEIFIKALSLSTELVICNLEDDTFLVELSFPGVFDSFTTHNGAEQERGL